uniref:Uncharacterized protein n=1 Tax=Rhizophagus irregularis (strain DAOM 181602 / DAOM 197198 / MUCL 43194) TaxID=747089 RepID=U9SWN3_RHIID
MYTKRILSVYIFLIGQQSTYRQSFHRKSFNFRHRQGYFTDRGCFNLTENHFTEF